jgi:FAD/FMN-containing dehydrogenase
MQKIDGLGNWNNYPLVTANLQSPYFLEDIVKSAHSARHIIARGNGRCYGDASLGGDVLSMLKFNNVTSFDKDLGIITCQSGVLLSDILTIIIPNGWFLPVTPGTQFITVGGAVASDVHGKNHHKEGSFANYVLGFSLLKPDGTIVQCSGTENIDLYWYTMGGMGLTGVILDVTFKLKKIESVFIREKRIRASNLEEILTLFDEYSSYTYSVAWIDCLKTGSSFGRSILMLGEHASKEEVSDLSIKRKFKFSVPFNFPSYTLNSTTIGLFNAFFYHKNIKKTSDTLVDYRSFFYPLDSIESWNRIYGKRGFIQYQFVVPKLVGRKGIEDILNRISKKGIGSFLAVLKSFGPGTVPMSFPINGYTLALDMPLVKGLFTFLDELDKIVSDFGGRIYLSKDARMDSEIFYKTYPNSYDFSQFVATLDPKSKFLSSLSRRLKIK